MKRLLLALAALIVMACHGARAQPYALIFRDWCGNNGNWVTVQLFPSQIACERSLNYNSDNAGNVADAAEGRALLARSSNWTRDCILATVQTMVCVPDADSRIDQGSLSYR